MTVTIELVKEASAGAMTVTGVTVEAFDDHPLHELLSQSGFAAKVGETQMVPGDDGVGLVVGLGPDDERMQAASNWIQQHWTLASNPGTHAGMGENAEYQGLFYYYETMARALTVCGVDTLAVAGGDEARQVSWRRELAAHLTKLQRADGSWLNEQNGRWWEDQPTMCTIYALLALADCQASSKVQ